MIILVGASASGKTAVAEVIVAKYGFQKLVTYTTRPKRQWEKEGVDYHFISEADFLNKQKNNFFFETVLYGNYHYGTAFKDIAADRVLIVEPQGASTYKQKLQDQAMVVYLATEEEERKERMIKRGDDPLEIEARLLKDRSLFSLNNIYQIDFVVLTRDLSVVAIADLIIQKYHLFINKRK